MQIQSTLIHTNNTHEIRAQEVIVGNDWLRLTNIKIRKCMTTRVGTMKLTVHMDVSVLWNANKTACVTPSTDRHSIISLRHFLMYYWVNGWLFLIGIGSDISVLPKRMDKKGSTTVRCNVAAINNTSISTYGTYDLLLELNLKKQICGTCGRCPCTYFRDKFSHSFWFAKVDWKNLINAQSQLRMSDRSSMYCLMKGRMWIMK